MIVVKAAKADKEHGHFAMLVDKAGLSFAETLRDAVVHIGRHGLDSLGCQLAQGGQGSVSSSLSQAGQTTKAISLLNNVNPASAGQQVVVDHHLALSGMVFRLGAAVQYVASDDVLQAARRVTHGRAKDRPCCQAGLHGQAKGARLGADRCVACHSILHIEGALDGATGHGNSGGRGIGKEHRHRIAAELANAAPIGVDEVNHRPKVAVEDSG